MKIKKFKLALKVFLMRSFIRREETAIISYVWDCFVRCPNGPLDNPVYFPHFLLKRKSDYVICYHLSTLVKKERKKKEKRKKEKRKKEKRKRRNRLLLIQNRSEALPTASNALRDPSSSRLPNRLCYPFVPSSVTLSFCCFSSDRPQHAPASEPLHLLFLLQSLFLHVVSPLCSSVTFPERSSLAPSPLSLSVFIP